MIETPEELLRQIRLGEDTALELKAVQLKGTRVSAPDRKELANEIAATANTADGTFVFGVDDPTKEVLGIPLDRLDTLERFLYEICSDSIAPPVVFRAYRMELPDSTGTPRAVLKMDIPRSLFVHRSPGGYFYRQGSSAREMAPELLARLFQQRSQARLIRFEEQPVPETGLEDLEEGLRGRFLGSLSEDERTTLHKMKLLTRDESGAERATVAGMLLCSKRPENRLPGALIEAVRYRGIRQDSNYQTDAQTITGPLDQQIRAAVAFARRNMQVYGIKRPGRVETPQYSIRAVFEAIVNAAAHRDYSIHGSKIRLFLFDDRLELYSPGALPNSVTIESLALRQSTRNELITSLLARSPVEDPTGKIGRQFYMEKRGDGVPIILAESRKLAGKTPEYRLIDDSELLLTIYAAAEPREEAADSNT